MMTGQGTSGSSTFTANISDFYYTGAVYTGSVSANYTAGTSINGTIIDNGTTSTFNGTAPATSDFNFNTPASLSAVTGSWTGSFLDGSSGIVTAAAGGTISGSS